jgi:hypothetical protein
MNKTSEMTDAEQNDSYQINVLLAYDSDRTCGAILGMFDRISTRLRDKKIFNVNAFRFGLLERMEPFKRTAPEAGAAELVMVAFGEEGAPGAGLLRWLENWAEHHEGQDSALGILPLGAKAGEPVRRFVRALRKIAARHSLRFIYGAEDRLGMLQEACTAAA